MDWPVYKLKVCNLVFIEFAQAEQQKVNKHLKCDGNFNIQCQLEHFEYEMNQTFHTKHDLNNFNKNCMHSTRFLSQIFSQDGKNMKTLRLVIFHQIGIVSVLFCNFFSDVTLYKQTDPFPLSSLCPYKHLKPLYKSPAVSYLY